MKDFSIKCQWAELYILFSFLEMLPLGRDGFLMFILGHCSSWTCIFASSPLGLSRDRWLAASNKHVGVLSSKQVTLRVDALSCRHFLFFLDASMTFWCFLENSAKDSSAFSKVEWCWISCLTHLESPKEKVNSGEILVT
jgi:hypothetical protein